MRKKHIIISIGEEKIDKIQHSIITGIEGNILHLIKESILNNEKLNAIPLISGMTKKTSLSPFLFKTLLDNLISTLELKKKEREKKKRKRKERDIQKKGRSSTVIICRQRAHVQEKKC